MLVLIFIGILLTQLLYVISNWRQYRRNDYVRYALYIVLFILYIICIFQDELVTATNTRQWLTPVTEAVKRPLAFLLYLVYFRFMDLFLELKEKYPALHRQVLLSNWIIAFFFLVQVVLVISGQAYRSPGNEIYFGFSFFLFALSVLVIIKAWRQPNLLTTTLLRGSICLVTGAFVTNIINIYKIFSGREIQVAPDYLPFFGGILLELFFFNMALAYKIVEQENELAGTQQLVIDQLRQNEQLVLEQQQTRNKIARDLHDEVGATLSGVTLFSELSLRNIARQQPLQVASYLQRISTECHYMSEKINDIVWAIHSEGDTLEKLLSRLQHYARQVCISKGITCEFHISEDVNQASFTPETRNHLYLFCKEAVNNAVKYSQATAITFTASEKEEQYTFRIEDNGVGFDTGRNYEGNGLKNMQSRVNEMDGSFIIESASGKGTTIVLLLKKKNSWV